MDKPRAYIGTSGYSYPHWGKGIFYPPKLPSARWLEHYYKYFSSVELNVTFYRLPSEKAYAGWYQRTPEKFLFALKGSRFITQRKRLKDCQGPLELFFEGAGQLREKLSVVLWQLPPSFKQSLDRLEEFSALLGRFSPIRQAFEFREESWFCPEVFQILKRYGMGLCLADWPVFDAKKSEDFDFIYLRRHGPGALYNSCYSEGQLKRDAGKIKRWLGKGKDVYLYFNNDAEGWAVRNASTLQKLLQISIL